MDFLFDNFQFVIIVILALASWLKTRSDGKSTAEDERRAREEMADEDSPFGQNDPWELPKTSRQPSVPPPIRREASAPPPAHRASVSSRRRELPKPARSATAPALEEALKIDPYEQDELLKRQREMQERLRQIKEKKSSGPQGARATRDRELSKGQSREIVTKSLPSIKETLSDARQSRRAIVLREVLGPPIALR